MNKEISLLMQTLGIMSAITGDSYDLDDIIIGSNQKMLDYSNGLLIEILELLEKGYTEEEIFEMIDACEFKDVNDLNNEEKEYLRKDAHKTLKKIIKNRKGDNKYE